MKRYLVTVFVGGKCRNLYYSDNFDDLVTIKAIYKDCEITIFDLEKYEILSKESVAVEINSSALRWKRSLGKPSKIEAIASFITESAGSSGTRSTWKRPVLCIETGQVFHSVRECSEHTGIPYMTITNCVKSGKPTRGIHFVDITTAIG